MRCYLVEGKGFEHLKLAERPVPTPRDHEVLIQVKACSLNYRDLLVVKGQYGGGNYPPFIPLSDMAGIVHAVGKEVTEWKEGDPVVNAPFRYWPAGTARSSWARSLGGGAGLDGVLAEYVTYPAESLFKIPTHLDFAEAATLPVAGLTAWSAIVALGKTLPGEWVLLQGTGGVSIFAAQLCQAINAKTILITSSEEKAQRVKQQFGVTETAIYLDPNWRKRVKEFTGGKGVDVVVDVAGGDTLANCVQLCTYGARIAVIGILSNSQSTISIFDLLTHQVTMKGIFCGSAEEMGAFVRAVETIQLKPVINKTFPFSETPDALHYLESQKHIGKVVILLKS